VDVEFYEEGNARYRLLEIIRQYARDRLQEAGCSGAARDRHLAFFAHLTGQAEPHLRGKGQVEWLGRLDQELDNLRVALEWSLVEHIDPGRKILADMFWFWHIRSYFREGTSWANKLLDDMVEKRSLSSFEEQHIIQRARVLRITPWLDAPFRTFPEDCRLAMLEESVLLMRKLGPSASHELAISLFFLDAWYKQTANPEMLEIFRQENDRSYINEYIFYLSQWALDRGNLAEATSYCEESLAMCREVEDIDGIGGRTGMLSFISLIGGNYTKAEALAQESLGIFREMRNWRAIIITLTHLSAIALADGNYGRARLFIDEALSKSREWALGYVDILWWSGKIAWAQEDTDRLELLGQEIQSELGGKLWPHLIVKADDLSATAALSQNNLIQAEIQIRKALSLIDLRWGVDFKASILRDCGVLFWRKGMLQESLHLFGAIQSQPYIMGQSPRQREEDDMALKSMHAALGEEAFAAAWEEGQAMTLEQARAYVLGEQDQGIS
jgi:tetratricopeptide (TPR) repeat protein